MKKYTILSISTLALLCAATPASADIGYQFVTIGNPGNADDTTGFGGVNYTYNIGKYEVTLN